MTANAMESHPISPLGPVKLAITMDDMLLFRGVPVPKNYSCRGIARARQHALIAERLGARPAPFPIATIQQS